jgi:hypothetical protein
MQIYLTVSYPDNYRETAIINSRIKIKIAVHFSERILNKEITGGFNLISGFLDL